MILFDLGGVLIDCGKFTKMVEWANWTKDPLELEAKWLASDAMTEYQRGNINTKEFMVAIMDELDLSVNVARFLRDFRLIPKGFFPGAEIVLKELRKKHVTACLSNTNELHWNKMCSVDKIEKHFNFCFPSHLIHMLKPEREIFDHVITTLKVEPSQIIYFDDRGENVDVAKEIGINAFKTESFNEVCTQLNTLGII